MKLTGTKLKFAPFFKDFQDIAAADPLMLGRMMRTVDEYEARTVPDAELEEGAMVVLNALSKKAALSLVTMQGRAACDAILERLKLARFFDSRFTRDDSLDRETQLRMALKSMKAKEAESIFVGDRINDLNAARAVGVRFVMIRKRSDSPPADALYRSLAGFARSRYVRG